MRFTTSFLTIVTLISTVYASCNCGLGTGYSPCGSSPSFLLPGGRRPAGEIIREDVEIFERDGKLIEVDETIREEKLPLVVRPAPNPKFEINFSQPKIVCKKIDGFNGLPLKPQGNLCSCGTTIVKPAIVPKPACAGCATKEARLLKGLGGALEAELIDAKLERSLSASRLDKDVLLGGLLPRGVPSSLLLNPKAGCDVLEEVRPIAPPADAVSLSIALKQQLENNLAIVEDKLSFGFSKLPKELPAPIVSPRKTIPEEKLYDINGEVLELKAAPCTLRGPKGLKELEEEALEEILNEELEAVEAAEIAAAQRGGIPLPSLTDLGYREASFKPSPFVPIENGIRKLGKHGLVEEIDVFENGRGVEIVDKKFGGGIGGLREIERIGGIREFESQIGRFDRIDGFRGDGACLDGFQPGKIIVQDLPVNPGAFIPPPPAIPCELHTPPTNPLLKVKELPPIVTFESSSSSSELKRAETSLLLQKLRGCL